MYRTISRRLWLVCIGLLAICFSFLALPFDLGAQSPPPVVISEVAWGGTAASTADEWIELYNNTGAPIDLTGWTLTDGGDINVTLSGAMAAGDYLLLERTDDNAVSDVPADLIYTGGLDNGGESLQLLDAGGGLIDTANVAGGPWPAGTGAPDYYSMERADTLAPDSPTNWAANDGLVRNGLDAAGNPLNGTPRRPNSAAAPPPAPGDVVINEVAWGGTAANAADEWIELFDVTTQTISLAGWTITSTGGLNVTLGGVISGQNYYLLERTDDNTISDVPADLTYTGGLGNGGETLYLHDAGGGLIDTANLAGGSWPAGTGAPDYYSMERTDPLAPDLPGSWVSNNGIVRNGLDANGNPINGSPKQPNSATFPVLPGDVVINEVAWSGTQADPADEWVELVNNTASAVALDGWQLTALDGTPVITLTGVVSPGGYFLIERDDDSAVADVPADLALPFPANLADGGETLQLTTGTLTIDTTNGDGGPWPAGTGAPDYRSLERSAPTAPDADANWTANDTLHRNGTDVAGNAINGTPGAANSSTVPPALLISEFLYDAVTPTTSGDEFVELCNAEPGPIDLTGFKVGDEETAGGGESMVRLPDGWILAPDSCLVIAKNAAQFAARFGFLPDFELVVAGSGYTDTPTVPELASYAAWGSGNWALADDGDELLVLGPADQLVDSVAYRNGDYTAVGVAPDASAPEPDSLQRVWPFDTDSMPADFVRKTPDPGAVTPLPAPPASPPAADLPGGMRAYWGILHSHSSYSDGAGPPLLAFATARSNSLHFMALADHDVRLTADEWADIGARAIGAGAPGEFVALRGYEYTHPTDGHITVWNTDTFAPRDDPAYDTLPEFYAWLAAQPDALAEFNHPFDGSDFGDFAYDPAAAPHVHLLEVGNGSELYAHYYTFEEQWMQALALGWWVAPANNSDSENAYWGADTAHRTGLVAPALTEADLLDAIRARRAFATEDSNLALTLRSGGVWMGSVISHAPTLTFVVNALDLDPIGESITLTLYDRTLPVASAAFAAPPVEWTVSLPGQPGHFYWARAVQADGDLAQTAPLWTDGEPAPETILLNEIVPAPGAVDWDGDGTADYRDEWVELYNAGGATVGLGGWRLGDASGAAYVIPMGTSISPGGYLVLYRRETDLALNNDADGVTLRRLDGTTADSYQYDDGPGYDVGLCRLPDGDGGWHDGCDPTPGGPNRALPAAGPVETTVFEARHNLPLDSWVRLRGQITVPPGVFSQRTAYLQDETGGIKIYLPKDHRLWASPGDWVEVTGDTQVYHGELEVWVSHRRDAQLLEPGDPLPPLPIGSGVMVEPYEGTLVLLDGWAVDFERGGHFWADDGTGWARVYLDPDTGISRPWLEVGQSVQAVGVVSQYTDEDPPVGGYRLMPRYPFDLVFSQPPADADFAWPSLLPETGRR